MEVKNKPVHLVYLVLLICPGAVLADIGEYCFCTRCNVLTVLLQTH